MDCAKYQDGLTQAALDALDALDPRHRAEWQAHLESCDDCRAELARRRSFLAAMDQAVARTAEGEPSPAFAACVRQRIEEQPAPAAQWLMGWLPVTASAVAVVALLVWVWNQQGPVQPAPDARPVAEMPPAKVPPAPDAVTETVHRPLVRIPAAHRAQPAPVIATTREPEVLVPAEQRAGVAWLYGTLRRDRTRATNALAGELLARAEIQQTLYFPELEAIPPLGIVPLVNREPSRLPQE